MSPRHFLPIPSAADLTAPPRGWRLAQPTEADEDLWTELASFATRKLRAPDFAFWVLTEPKRFGDALADPQLAVAEELPEALPDLFRAGLIRCGAGGLLATLPKADLR